MKYAYTDFAHPILDYISTLSKKEIVFDLLFPLVLSSITSFAIKYHSELLTKDFVYNVLSVCINTQSILLGFTITSIAVFCSINPNEHTLLGKTSDRVIRGTTISWYRYIFSHLIYTAVSGVFLLIIILISLSIHDKTSFQIPILFTATLYLLHILHVSVRNITNIYFAFFLRE